MWVLGENATESNRCKVNLEVSAAESKIMAKKNKTKQMKEPRHKEEQLYARRKEAETQNTAVPCGRGTD